MKPMTAQMINRGTAMLLENKNAVIYGGGGTIGGAVARAFAREGAKVFLPKIIQVVISKTCRITSIVISSKK
jgi:S-adenosylhomocysteine hydrolase